MYNMSSINLSYIKPRNTLQTAAHLSDLTNAIVAKVKEIDNYLDLKHDAELLIFICNCIENAVKDKKAGKKVDKKALCLDILDKIFLLTPDDTAMLSSSIDFLCNNKLVSLIPSLKKYTLIIINYLKSKL